MLGSLKMCHLSSSMFVDVAPFALNRLTIRLFSSSALMNSPFPQTSIAHKLAASQLFVHPKLLDFAQLVSDMVYFQLLAKTNSHISSSTDLGIGVSACYLLLQKR